MAVLVAPGRLKGTIQQQAVGQVCRARGHKLVPAGGCVPQGHATASLAELGLGTVQSLSSILGSCLSILRCGPSAQEEFQSGGSPWLDSPALGQVGTAPTSLRDFAECDPLSVLSVSISAAWPCGPTCWVLLGGTAGVAVGRAGAAGTVNGEGEQWLGNSSSCPRLPGQPGH